MNKVIRLSFWRSGIASLGGLVIFVLLMSVFRTAPDIEGIWFITVGILIALIPALLWLTFFYQQDRKEPEPKRVAFRDYILYNLIETIHLTLKNT